MQNKNETKQVKYNTIQEYLEKYLYPVLQIAMDQVNIPSSSSSMKSIQQEFMKS